MCFLIRVRVCVLLLVIVVKMMLFVMMWRLLGLFFVRW